MEVVLDRIAGRARYAERVVLSGISAGGFGVVLTYGLAAERLAPAPVDLLDDSGPFLADDAVFDPGLQREWRTLWNLDAALPPGCTDCSLPNGDGLENVLPYYARAYPGRTFGFLSHRDDRVIRVYFGLGGPDCPGDPSACLISGREYDRALFGLRALLPSNAGTYYAEGADHTFLLQEDFYTTAVGDVPLTAWIGALVSGQAAHVPPLQGGAPGVADAE
jgi:hypothetical protein